jgi:hypothetical protein
MAPRAEFEPAHRGRAQWIEHEIHSVVARADHRNCVRKFARAALLAISCHPFASRATKRKGLTPLLGDQGRFQNRLFDLNLVGVIRF